MLTNQSFTPVMCDVQPESKHHGSLSLSSSFFVTINNISLLRVLPVLHHSLDCSFYFLYSHWNNDHTIDT